tara:strand:- start:70 stop:1137 length:1068 start_codon:yes stop_codon:yes gene_type:complete
VRYKGNISGLNRIQTSLNRDLRNGTLLDRNERVDYFDNQTFKKILNNISRFSLNATPDITSLYKQIAQYHKLKVSNVYVGQGITEIISHILFSTVKEKDEVIFFDQTYPMYEVLCKLHNVNVKLWKFDSEFQLSLKELNKIITKKTKIIFLVNPNLPIEYELSKKYKEEIYKICKKKNILLVYDEAYYYFGAKSEISKINKHKNLIIMRTFSKAWGLPGIRLGYMISNSKLCEYISKCRSLVETNAFSFQIAMWALKNKRILNEHVKQVKKGSLYLRKKLKSIGAEFYGGKVTNAIILKLPNVDATENLRKYMASKKIYIRTKFKGPIDNYVRISLGSPKKLSGFVKEYINWKKK